MNWQVLTLSCGWLICGFLAAYAWRATRPEDPNEWRSRENALRRTNRAMLFVLLWVWWLGLFFSGSGRSVVDAARTVLGRSK